MKKLFTLVVFLLCISVLFAGSSFAFDRKELGKETLYTRTNIKVSGKTVFFHNMSAIGTIIPAGTPVIITGTSGRSIKFRMLDKDVTYKITDRPSVYNKYFVKDKAEIGLSNMSEKAKKAISTMSVYPGMSKNEVFVSKGCPAYIAYGEKSWGHSLKDLMNSNTWYYNLDTRRRSVIIHFTDGVVSDIKERY